MKKAFKIGILLFIGLILISTVNADWNPRDNITGKDKYNITDFHTISATLIEQNGSSGLLDTNDINSTTWNFSRYANDSYRWDNVDTYNSSELDTDSNGNLGILDSFINVLVDNRVTQSFIKALGFYDSNQTYNLNETYNKTEIDNFGFYNLSDFDISDYLLSSDEPNLNVNSSDYWDNLNDVNDITDIGTLDNLTVTNNVTASWFKGLINWSNVQNKFIESVGDYFYMVGTELNLNTTATNNTITQINDEYNESIHGYVDDKFIVKDNETNLNVNSSTYWDDISSQSEITEVGTLDSLDVTNNVTASWFNGQVLWSNIANKFIESVGRYFYMDGTQLNINSTELNATIDDRTAIASNLSTDGGIKIVGTTFSVEAGNGLRQETDGLAVEDAGINNTLLRWKTGQNLTTTDDPTFNDLNLDGTLQPTDNITFGKGWIISQGEYGCLDASCNHYIYENSSGVLIIE